MNAALSFRAKREIFFRLVVSFFDTALFECGNQFRDLSVLDFLDKNGDPPALLGRHQQFDSTGSLIVTPKREPPSNTLRRNHETSRKFKSHTVGV